jgi:hypothetical protein
MFASCVFLFSAAVAAPPSPSPTPKPAELGKPFELKAGEFATVGGAGLKVGFQGVSEDSRCPVNVQCVWEGDAAVEVTLEKPPAAKATRSLHTSARNPRETAYEGLKVRLKDLAPLPKEGATLDAKEYRATLVVEAP